jgi:hypothetical protein
MPVYIDNMDIEETIRQLQRLNPRLRAAANRAVRKTVTWSYNSIINSGATAADLRKRPSALARGIRLPRGKRVHRRDLKVRSKGSEASVYTGYNPLKTHYIGKIPKWKKGQTPRVRSHKFPGAFVVKFKNGYDGIFKRSAGGKLKEETLPLPQVEQVVRQLRPKAGMYLKGVLATELEKELLRIGAL